MNCLFVSMYILYHKYNILSRIFFNFFKNLFWNFFSALTSHYLISFTLCIYYNKKFYKKQVGVLHKDFLLFREKFVQNFFAKTLDKNSQVWYNRKFPADEGRPRAVQPLARVKKQGLFKPLLIILFYV